MKLAVALFDAPVNNKYNLMNVFLRLESDFPFGCDMNYEVIKISLIDSENMHVNLSTSLSPEYYVNSLTQEEVEHKLNVTRELYEPFPTERNRSYVESFMYSVENITTIFNTTQMEEQQPCNMDMKLSRRMAQFTPSGVFYYSGEYYWPKEYCIQS